MRDYEAEDQSSGVEQQPRAGDVVMGNRRTDACGRDKTKEAPELHPPLVAHVVSFFVTKPLVRSESIVRGTGPAPPRRSPCPSNPIADASLVQFMTSAQI